MITVVDYGMGNLRSVVKAFEHVGAEVEVVSTAKAVDKATALVVPGVGAFDDCMTTLGKANLDEAINRHIFHGKPYLGICLGHQILFEAHEESRKKIPGLGIFPGTVRRFPSDLKVPHMGWNQIKIYRKKCPLLRGVEDGEMFYFVHSYYTEPLDSRIVATRTDYGVNFTSMIWDGSLLYSVQFHPEKSQNAGLQILKNYTELYG
ncbi:MAG: imidazole glycerol phosphate synthase subunit HisH [Candidatus Auribacterota bacterium]|jgi:glutamine amidotransferase|uniref:Imidazole glycerol phosphate synthase subunit HisH n=1 Tax=Candidatus Auribacter fodinae TaxID=2093366 RepID=A0A3A4QRL8_9BACT|nr:MAG: imidazole glycerol phosphate synthase subunit HisH [Candidatus Auribacter fodinae]